MQLEELLIKQCKKNDPKAQKELYLRYSKAMYNICSRMLADQEKANDILQEAFIAVFSKIDQFKGGSFAAWIKRIVINKCVNEIKKNSRVSWENIDDHPVEEVSNDHEEQLNVDFAVINDCIKQLPDGCRMVFILKVMEDYNHSDISEELKISESTSKSQLARAKQLLRISLSKSMVA